MKLLVTHKLKLQIAILLLITFTAGFAFGAAGQRSMAQGNFAIGDVDQAFAPFWEAYDVIQTRYVDTGTVSVPELVDGAIKGMTDALKDKYSSYMTADQYSAFNVSLSGNIEGIGVTIDSDEKTGDIFVVGVIEGAAAVEAGIRPGDVFWEVDGHPVTGMNQSDLATLVRGPAGTHVHVKFKRGDGFVDFDLTRTKFEVPTVESRIVDNDIAYIKLAEFNAVALEQVNAAIQKLDVNSHKGLIFDLRGNPGGFLNTAVDIGSLFIDKGVLLYETFGDGTEQTFEATGKSAHITVPIVVLVDETSASASELVSGAIKDHHVATLIGEKTFGKGTVQTIQQLSNGGGLRITIARWLTPNRNWIHGLGITPDITVEWNPQTSDDFAGPDPQLQAAVDFLSK